MIAAPVNEPLVEPKNWKLRKNWVSWFTQTFGITQNPVRTITSSNSVAASGTIHNTTSYYQVFYGYTNAVGAYFSLSRDNSTWYQVSSALLPAYTTVTIVVAPGDYVMWQSNVGTVFYWQVPL